MEASRWSHWLITKLHGGTSSQYIGTVVASLGSRCWEAEMRLQLYPRLPPRCFVVTRWWGSVPCVRKVLYLLKGAARISRQISEKYHGTVITVTGERTGYPVMVT